MAAFNQAAHAHAATISVSRDLIGDGDSVLHDARLTRRKYKAIGTDHRTREQLKRIQCQAGRAGIEYHR